MEKNILWLILMGPALCQPTASIGGDSGLGTLRRDSAMPRTIISGEKQDQEALTWRQRSWTCASSTGRSHASNDYPPTKAKSKELHKITRRIEQLEAEMEELNQKSRHRPYAATSDTYDLSSAQSDGLDNWLSARQLWKNRQNCLSRWNKWKI